MHVSERVRQVQSPIIPIVGEWTRNSPGTISLGQGIAFYGPPPQALAALRTFHTRIENHQYQDVQGIRPLIDKLKEKLARENRQLKQESAALKARIARLEAALLSADERR